MKDSGARGCFKYGCIGCLTLAALVAGLIFLLAVIDLSVDRAEPKPETKELSHDLPGRPLPPEMPPTGEADVATFPEVLPLPEGAAPELPSHLATGKVVLDIAAAELTIVPGPPGAPIRVEADYDSASYELEEKLTSSEDGGWSYKLDFGARGGFSRWFFDGGDNAHNRLKLIIPSDYPIELEGKVGVGQTEADLGGLWLREIDLDFGAGEHFVEFREPLREPMGRFKVKSAVGSVELRSLGNASPESVSVKHSIGELLVDLTGAWRRDAGVRVDFSIGECKVWLPESARVELDRTTMAIGEVQADEPRGPEELPADAPTLNVKLSGSIGELRVRR
ncbi:MAG: hypothetical protein HC897_01805 [Thermoanaerobaculia bacterium]|nr:hypothetical protein [Thermoanaerobaculia bacterium]